MDRILVTPRSLTESPHPALTALAAKGFEVVYTTAGKTPSEGELIERVRGCVGWLAGVEKVTPAVIAAADSLKVIGRNGVGVDNLPMAAVTERGIKVVVAAGANAAGVAELAITLMLCSLRHVPVTDAGIKAGKWPRHKGFEIRTRTVGVIGCGAIGRDVARLAGALGAKIIAFDPLRPALDAVPASFRWASFEEAIADSDIVTLHCPSPKDGTSLIGAQQLATMRRGAILVNTARASLVDEAAVLAALESGQLSGYATDVFPEEPPQSLTLASHPGVIATSHIGGFTQESVDRAVETAVANMLAVLRP